MLFIDAEEEDYKKKMAVERENASKRKREYTSDEHFEKARTTGLSVEVIALMDKQARYDEDTNNPVSNQDKEKEWNRKKKKKHSSDSSSHSSDKKKKHKRKKHKHSKKSRLKRG